jgi:nicotinamide-nucleotide amidase
MKQLLSEHVLPRLATWHKDHSITTYQRVFEIFNLPETGQPPDQHP